jgi:DNA-binding response OmpR family regulator
VILVRPRIVVSACLSEDVRTALEHEGFDLVDSGTADLAVVALDELPHVRGMRVIVVAGERDVVAALTAGADDVVPRSVAPVELAARMRAILRRTHAPSDVLRYADIVLDVTRSEARRGGREIELTATELRLLRYLLERPGRVLSKAQILDNVWPTEPPGSNVVETYVKYLRRKLDAFGPPLIRTVRSVGYMLDEFTA